MNPLAIISDIHGNIWALDAVLEDIERRGIRDIVNLGDHFYGPLAPGQTAERLTRLAIPSVRGNQDRQLIEPAASPHPTHVFTMSELGEAHLDWLRAQPANMVYGEMLLCHGSPSSDTEYLLEEVTAEGVRLRLLDRIPGEHPIVLCGHTHIPRVVAVEGRMAINPGSVGLPAYSDDAPLPHKMETGSPHARYAIFDGESVDLIALRYNYRAAADAARAHQREDWAHAIQTGRAT